MTLKQQTKGIRSDFLYSKLKSLITLFSDVRLRRFCSYLAYLFVIYAMVSLHHRGSVARQSLYRRYIIVGVPGA